MSIWSCQSVDGVSFFFFFLFFQNSLLMWHTSLCNTRNENETVPDQRCCMLARNLPKQVILPILMDNRRGLAFELVLGLQPIWTGDHLRNIMVFLLFVKITFIAGIYMGCVRSKTQFDQTQKTPGSGPSFDPIDHVWVHSWRPDGHTMKMKPTRDPHLILLYIWIFKL